MSKGFGKFVLGSAIGAGIALLFAPQEGSKTRKELKIKIDELIEKLKEVDPSDVKNDILDRIEDLKNQIKDLDKEKVLAAAKSGAAKVEKKAAELYEVAKEKSTPVVEKAVKEVKNTALKAAKEVVNRLEEDSKSTSTKTVSKKTVKKPMKKSAAN